MSSRRLRNRAPSTRRIARARLCGYRLTFHKIGRLDESGKCDICFTGNPAHTVYGVLYWLKPSEKKDLDRAEGLDNGYALQEVAVLLDNDIKINAFTYYATYIDPGLKPFHWYKEHVLAGARENQLPPDYIALIECCQSIPDPDPDREVQERALYRSQ